MMQSLLQDITSSAEQIPFHCSVASMLAEHNFECNFIKHSIIKKIFFLKQNKMSIIKNKQSAILAWVAGMSLSYSCILGEVVTGQRSLVVVTGVCACHAPGADLIPDDQWF